MGTLNDEVMKTTGGPTLCEGLRNWYIAGGATGTTLNDLERSYLEARTVRSGTINDMWMELLTLSGYTGTLNDMQLQFWTANPTP